MPSPIGSFAFFFGKDSMATSFVARQYIQALQTLLDRQGVNATVYGFQAGRDLAKLATRPAVELQIDDFAIRPSGILRTIDGTLTATLLVLVRLDHDKSEEEAFELALDVATSLVDEHPTGVPVIAGGPILVTSIQPEVLDGAAEDRIACFSVTYEQMLSISRTNTIPDYAITNVLLGKEPLVGLGNVAAYEQVVPVPEE